MIIEAGDLQIASADEAQAVVGIPTGFPLGALPATLLSERLAEDLQPAPSRHLLVEQHQVVRPLTEQLERVAVAAADRGRGPFADAIKRMGRETVRERYGNLFDMYEKITGENGYQVPMRIFPAVHYAMGGTWVDYNLMSTLPGLFVLGEANFSDHGANRLGASALMQGLADGYFIIPYTLANYIAGTTLGKVTTDHDAFAEAAHAVQARIEDGGRLMFISDQNYAVITRGAPAHVDLVLKAVGRN